MSGADLLRRAAAKLREHAEAAAEGPWRVDGDLQAVKAKNGVTIAYDDETEMSDGRYIALMHPPVAVAVAALLEAEAARYERVVGGWLQQPAHIQAQLGAPIDRLAGETFAASLAAARAVLREEES